MARAVAGALTRTLVAERQRWVLWLPVALGTGIAFYFSLPYEPEPWLLVSWPVLGIAGAFATRRTAVPFLLSIGLATAGCGFAVSGWRTAAVSTPVLAKRLGPAEVRGRVTEAALRPYGMRLVLEHPEIEGLSREATPGKVRVVVRGSADAPMPGDHVTLLAILNPPSSPAAPEAYDFARRAYFQGLGAVGFSLGGLRATTPAAEAGGRDIASWIATLRQDIGERVRASLQGPAGAVATALMTGRRGAIPEDVLADLRDSGLAHLLAISGLHVGLVAGLMFFGVRALLALVEPVALRHPIKKWAAVAALLAAFAYLALTGGTIPTQRAFLMATLVLLAVILDRTAVSMRLVVWAAIAVLLGAPESLLGPSFQMSFAAVVALVAVYEAMSERFSGWRANAGPGRRAMVYLAAVALTTLVAGSATAPFAIFHFNRVVSYGLLANVVAVPLMGFWIMPWAMIAYLLMPFGLEGVGLAPMGWGIDGVVGVAHAVASLPGAVTLLPAMPMEALALVSLGGLWLCLWGRRWRLLGLLGIVAGLATLAFVRTPDVLVDGRGKLLAVKAADGGLMISSRRTARTTGKTWLRRAGQAESRPWPRLGAGDDGRLNCDPLGCLYRNRGQTVALVRDPRALADDCRVATVVVSLVPVRRACAAVPLVIDRFDLWRHGGHALWLDPDGVRVETVNGARGARPWVPARGR